MPSLSDILNAVHDEADDSLRVKGVSGFGGTDPVGLKDTVATPINPAKEDGNLASIKAKTDNVDLALTVLRDALRGINNKTLSDLVTLLAAGLPAALVGGRLDVNVGNTPSVDTELPAAAAIADDESATPSVPRVAAITMGMDANGGSNLDRARLAKVHNVATGGPTEYAIGISWRKTASGASVEFGTPSDPVRVDPTGTTTQPVNNTQWGGATLSAAAALGDGTAVNPTTNKVGAIPLLMNATTGDRQRAVINGTNSTGTGIAAVGLVGQLDDTSPTAITENQFGNIRIGADRGIMISGSIIDNNAFTDGTTRVNPAGYILDETAGTALTENDAAAARIDSKRAQVYVLEDETTRGRRQTVTSDKSAAVAPIPGTDSARSPSNNKDAGSVTKANAKASAGNVFSFRVTNVNAAVRYFQIHNKATAPAAGDTALRYYLIPAGSATNPAVLEIDRAYLADAINCSTGIGWAISTTPTTFTDAATASDHTVDLNYA